MFSPDITTMIILITIVLFCYIQIKCRCKKSQYENVDENNDKNEIDNIDYIKNDNQTTDLNLDMLKI